MYWAERFGEELWSEFMRGRGNEESRERAIGTRIHQAAAKYNARTVVADALFVGHYYSAYDRAREHVPLMLVWTTLPLWREGFLLCDAIQIVLCPVEFELPQFRISGGKLRYLEPSIDFDRSEAAFDWSQIDSSKPLILCSFGTQTSRHREMDERIQATVEAAKLLVSFQFVIALGQRASTARIIEQDAPSNVYAAPVIPLLQLLQRAKLLITHGGLGSIKEALYFGVPMLVIPFGFDQPFNAVRIRNFGVGSCLHNQEIKAETIASRITSLVNDRDVARRIAVFSNIFQERSRRPEVTALIEETAEQFISETQTARV